VHAELSADGDRWTVVAGDARVELVVAPTRVVWAVKRDVPDGPPGDEALLAIAGELCRRMYVANARLLTWDSEKAARWNRALLGAGFEEHRRKAFVTRDLTADLPPAREFGWRTLAEVGEGEFFARLVEASDGDPFDDDERDTDQEWRDLLTHAGDGLDPTLWRIALVDGEVAGVVLPTTWPDGKGDGTISNIGLLPSYRGRGLGRGLHAAGLHLLANAGATRYRGSTDVRNAPMMRIFEQNECPVTGTQLFLAATGT
jgi:ribosomal protein S18 acetylase RimI-like enzyme